MNKERILIFRAQTLHDREAFSALVKIYQGKIRAFLVRLCKDYDLGDDLAQDTFIKAHQKLDSYSGKGSFSSWLFAIGYNCFLQQHRSHNRYVEVSEQYSQEFVLREDAYDSISPEQIDLEKAISTLKVGQAAAITLCHSYGFSHQEAADILELPVGTIKTNILRGKAKLKDVLNNESRHEQRETEQSKREAQ